MNFLEKLHGSLYSKTAQLGVFITVIGLAEQTLPGVIARVVPAEYYGLAISTLGVIIWCLRWITSKPLEEKAK